ncbi:MAG: hypothetical protein PW843_24520 [Azospirillaceae bacterium]|nr:hypothetical protein [Azospirillaceae bacterium]
MLAFYLDSAEGEEGRRGCLVAGAATDMSTFDPEMAAVVAGALAATEAQIGRLVTQGQADGSIPASVDAAATTVALLCLLQGLRVVGKTARPRDTLAAAVATALKLLD